MSIGILGVMANSSFFPRSFSGQMSVGVVPPGDFIILEAQEGKRVRLESLNSDASVAHITVIVDDEILINDKTLGANGQFLVSQSALLEYVNTPITSSDSKMSRLNNRVISDVVGKKIIISNVAVGNTTGSITYTYSYGV